MEADIKVKSKSTYDGPGPVKPGEVVEGAYVSPEVFKWLDENWDSIPDDRKPLFEAIGRVAFDEGYLADMRRQGRL